MGRWSVVAWGLFLPLGGCALLRGGATAELQLGFEVAQQRAALAEAQVQGLGDRIERMEQLLKEQGIDSSSGFQSLGEVASEVASLRGVSEEQSFAARTLRTDFDAYTVGQERRQLHDELRLSELERVLGVTTPAAPRIDGSVADGGAASTPSTPTTPSGDSVTPNDEVPQDLAGRLALAELRMEQGMQAAARAVLQLAIEGAPAKDPLLPEAHYRLAETWFNEQRFKDAAKSFQVVQDKFPTSSWAPWATLRIGECFEGLGRKDAADTFYQGVIRNHPNSDAANSARQKLGI